MKKLSYLLIMFAIVFASCEGPIGPIGPTGDAGTQGTQGVAGTNGADGEDGNNGTNGADGEDGADALAYNFSLTFTSSDTWKTYMGLGSYDKEKDAVLVYYNYTENDIEYHSLLPYTLLRSGAENILFYSEIGTIGNVYINTVWANGDTGSPWASNVTLYFKAILIKGEAGNKSNIDYSDYDAVMKFYNL